MPDNEPTAEALHANQDYGPPIPWEEGRERLAAVASYALTTLSRDGKPHTRPLLAVWLEGSMYFSSKGTSGKGRNLSRDSSCSLHGWSAEPKPLDIVVEGQATRVTDDSLLRRVAGVYDSKYGWKVQVRDGRFDAEYGAPTAGKPPFNVYQLTPSQIYAFPGVGGGDESRPMAPTLWRF